MTFLRPLALVLLLAGCAEKKESAPKPPPPPPGSLPLEKIVTPVAVPPLDFAAYGDCRSERNIHSRICANLLRSAPKFVIVTGDLVDGGVLAEWDIFHDITKDLRAKTEYLAAPGNHDVPPYDGFLKEFGLEKPYYDRRIGDIHLFMLDSNRYFEDPEQLKWLDEKASKSDARHKFAAFHHPPFSLEGDEYEKKPVRENLHPILVKHRFCAAFCGHHHVFYATVRDGVRYVITAGGGAPLYPLLPSLALKGDVFREFHHYVGFTIQEKRITARVFDPDGVEAPELAFTLCEHP